MAFVQNPAIASKSALDQQRRQKNFQEMAQLEKKVGLKADSYNRMLNREDAGFRNAAMAQPSRITKKQLDLARREEMVAANT